MNDLIRAKAMEAFCLQRSFIDEQNEIADTGSRDSAFPNVERDVAWRDPIRTSDQIQHESEIASTIIKEEMGIALGLWAAGLLPLVIVYFLVTN